ncbi:MAG: hypothetical protein N2V73_06880 [Candidatus Methanospirare jalkutatii]|nr:hypothetical protein [Candidatus Methanospirare jalkutatii]MCW7080158.1 hypothetical protein [Candidatus Methanospirare jalkutatii]
MRIEKITHNPYDKSVLPSIVFEIEIKHKKYQEAIIGVYGWLETDDGKIIASINEIPKESKAGELGARGSYLDKDFKEEIYKTKVIAQLTKQALDYIEKRRGADRKKNVNFILNLIVKYIHSRAVISPSYLINPEEIGLNKIQVSTSRGEEKGEIIVYVSDDKFRTSYTNRWIISGDGGPVFLEVREQLLKKDVTISSVDWIYDYVPKFGMGEYFIIEIPKGEKIIKEAWDYVEKAEECFRTWDTKGVFANCREVGELLDKTISNKFKNSPTIKKWKRAIGKFEYSASLDLHVEEISKKEKPEGDIKIGRAEAEHILIITKALIKYAEELLKED